MIAQPINNRDFSNLQYKGMPSFREGAAPGGPVPPPVTEPVPAPGASTQGGGSSSGSSYSVSGGGGGSPSFSLDTLLGNKGAPVPQVNDQGLGSLLTGKLKGMVEGGETAFTPEVMSRIKANAKSALEGQAGANADALNYDLIQRGMFNSPEAARGQQAIRQGVAQGYSQAVNQAELEKARTDFQDKLAGIDRAEANLNALRADVLSRHMSETQRQQMLGQLALGYENVNVQRQQLSNQASQFEAQYGLASRQQDFAEKQGTINVGGVDMPVNQLALLLGLI